MFSDGLLVTCGYDYLTDDWNHKSYLLYAFINHFALPMLLVIFFYSQVNYLLCLLFSKYWKILDSQSLFEKIQYSPIFVSRYKGNFLCQ